MDLFEFWADVPGNARVHPLDAPILDRSKHSFDLGCLPSNVDGNLREARLVLLFVNPGMDDADLIEADLPIAHRKYEQMRSGSRQLRGEDDPSRAHKWLSRITKVFGPWDTIQQKAAVLNIAAYHSYEFSDDHMLAALPSSRTCLDWAQRVLFPEAERGERVVICLRAARFWGLGKQGKYGKGLFAPATFRGAHMQQGGVRDEAIDAARAILNT